MLPFLAALILVLNSFNANFKSYSVNFSLPGLTVYADDAGDEQNNSAPDQGADDERARRDAESQDSGSSNDSGNSGDGGSSSNDSGNGDNSGDNGSNNDQSDQGISQDGQNFDDQSPSTKDDFVSVYGSEEAAKKAWAEERNGNLARGSSSSPPETEEQKKERAVRDAWIQLNDPNFENLSDDQKKAIKAEFDTAIKARDGQAPQDSRIVDQSSGVNDTLNLGREDLRNGGNFESAVGKVKLSGRLENLNPEQVGQVIGILAKESGKTDGGEIANLATSYYRDICKDSCDNQKVLTAGINALSIVNNDTKFLTNTVVNTIKSQFDSVPTETKIGMVATSVVSAKPDDSQQILQLIKQKFPDATPEELGKGLISLGLKDKNITDTFGTDKGNAIIKAWRQAQTQNPSLPNSPITTAAAAPVVAPVAASVAPPATAPTAVATVGPENPIPPSLSLSIEDPVQDLSNKNNPDPDVNKFDVYNSKVQLINAGSGSYAYTINVTTTHDPGKPENGFPPKDTTVVETNIPGFIGKQFSVTQTVITPNTKLTQEQVDSILTETGIYLAPKTNLK